MMILLLLAVLAVLLAWRMIFERYWEKDLTVKIGFTEGAVYAGEETILTEEITNRKKLALPEIEAAFRIQKGVRFPDAENIIVSDYVYKRDIFSLRKMEAVTRRYRLACENRGRYRISQVTVRGWSFFHTRKYELEADETDDLLVYAGYTDISGLEAMCSTLLGEVQGQKRLYEDPFAFASIREYQPTDPMKQINWKATARTGELMVNTYTSVRSEQFMVFLDIDDRRIMKEAGLVETCISAAATLIRKVIRNGQEVGLAVNTDPPTVIEPKRGYEQLQEIERFLTEDFSSKKTMSLASLWDELAEQGKDRICVLITKEREPGLRDTLAERKNRTYPLLLATARQEEGIGILDVQVI